MSFSLALQWVFAGIGFLLEILIISAVLRHGRRTYALVLVYSVVLFLTSVVEAAAILAPRTGWTLVTRDYYWVGEFLRQFLIFSIIIWFTYRRLLHSPAGRRAARWLVAAAILFTAASIALTRNPLLNLWFTTASRNLSFCALILNLILWGVLLRDRRRDRRMLTVSGGLGIQMAGQAIGQSLRQMYGLSRSLVWAGNLVIVASHLLSLYILWTAFRGPTETDGPSTGDAG